ncbi:MAG: polysaccharide biosynthesis protein, partial [Verrucomicrobiaceae bacterium]|nr:polysaccharide biosynthesis protein [Verrucomicrobiaceae bacterium]
FAESFRQTIGMVVFIFVVLILLFRLYQGLWRFFTFRDCVVTAAVLALGTALVMAMVFLRTGGGFLHYPRSVPMIFFLLFLGWEIGGRGIVRLFREWRIAGIQGRRVGARKKIILVGDTAESDQVIRALERQAGDTEKVVAVFANVKAHIGSKIHGIPIYGDQSQIGAAVTDLGADSIVILPPFTAPRSINRIVESVTSEKVNCEFRVIPSYNDIASGRIDVGRIRRVEISDLLERNPYEVDYEHLQSFVKGKRVLVTGAGGSIGSEICRQVIRLQPEALLLFEISEFLLFEIERELLSLGTGVKLLACAGDVRNRDQIKRAMDLVDTVEVVFHAAAYKHVDLMERNPEVCFLNNVIGTVTMAEMAEKNGVEDFVLISSDKAVRPTSLMGASKRMAERCIMERPDSKTRFKAVRFGNVLGSSGSVVPIFTEQIARGGPVTVTSKEVTRYFMTIPEAVELVIVAGSQPVDRRVFVLEMGEAVKIDAMARRMIELSGFVPEVDIAIVYTGLKKGEKEYEELLTDDEDVVATDLDRIWVVKKNVNGTSAKIDLGYLLELIDEGDEAALREYAHSLIPGSRLLPDVVRC